MESNFRRADAGERLAANHGLDRFARRLARRQHEVGAVLGVGVVVEYEAVLVHAREQQPGLLFAALMVIEQGLARAAGLPFRNKQLSATSRRKGPNS